MTVSLKSVSLVGGLVLSITMAFVMYFGFGHNWQIASTLAVVVLCAVWWVFEPIPMAATSLLPFAIFPMTGVLSSKDVGAAFGNPMVLLILGGFMLSTAMQRSGTHRRIALAMVHLFAGNHPSNPHSARRIVFGFMAASAFLSMWISNSATTLMLLPIVIAVCDSRREENEDKCQPNSQLAICLLLGIAFASSIGGIATPIGTPPNLVFMQIYGGQSALGVEVQVPDFLTWMSWTLPITLVMIPISGLWLTRNLSLSEPLQIPEAGKWRSEEVRTLAVFVITAILWITRTSPLGGWSSWLGIPGANDASVALISVVAMHIIPNGKGETLLTWESASKIPWGILILFGGGIAIADAFQASGLSSLIGHSITFIKELPTWVMIFSIAIFVTFLTEVTSNTAVANLLLPILAATALASDIDPKLLMVPATISASFAFMLPVATAPNAIIFGSERLTIRTMAKEGLVLNLTGAVVISVVCWWLFAPRSV